ncbi:MAG: hypothetical protein AB4426_26125 [Xenococcaceae cyanobacterium]
MDQLSVISYQRLTAREQALASLKGKRQKAKGKRRGAGNRQQGTGNRE